MSVLVVGCGRSGSNMVLEILRGSPTLKATSIIEDKTIFKNPHLIKDNYLSKCDTWYIPTLDHINKLMNLNPNLYIAFSLRHPKDMVLSKIKRGQPGEDGNSGIAEDATTEGCIKDINHMFNCYLHLKKYYEKRIFLIKMEEIIENIELTCNKLCKGLKIEYNENMLNFTSRMRNLHKKNRYKKLDKEQINLWKRKNEIYGGFFKDNKKYNIEEIFNKIDNIIKYFNYEEINNSTSRF